MCTRLLCILQPAPVEERPEEERIPSLLLSRIFPDQVGPDRLVFTPASQPEIGWLEADPGKLREVVPEAHCPRLPRTGDPQAAIAAGQGTTVGPEAGLRIPPLSAHPWPDEIDHCECIRTHILHRDAKVVFRRSKGGRVAVVGDRVGEAEFCRLAVQKIDRPRIMLVQMALGHNGSRGLEREAHRPLLGRLCQVRHVGHTGGIVGTAVVQVRPPLRQRIQERAISSESAESHAVVRAAGGSRQSFRGNRSERQEKRECKAAAAGGKIICPASNDRRIDNLSASPREIRPDHENRGRDYAGQCVTGADLPRIARPTSDATVSPRPRSRPRIVSRPILMTVPGIRMTSPIRDATIPRWSAHLRLPCLRPCRFGPE